ncbi:serine/threonine-protein kinase Genghis Khan-like [Tropilaelaps mercedesae]|uniref:non-specific serine/threonine protein kinase n=1 Tax=Tropilaelaps mercedesae TaxID=418985 RepID=A0A1V9XK27_9ACAR|nr:serine/threonine-protein kinase Genghis Khan-like [Tropilaelaps mercedesae]
MAGSLGQRVSRVDNMFLRKHVRVGGTAFTVDSLIDCLLLLYDECVRSSLAKEKTLQGFVKFVSPVVAEVRNQRLARSDFEILKVIGRGAFGEVAVVREKNSHKVYAMKILNKWEMLKRAETACFQEERDVLVFGDKRWITNLHYSFQDQSNLYLVMDYYCGGDLLTLLSKFEDRLPEDMAKFYIAEMILAIHSLHVLRYVHRDVKPDNVLLDAQGHIRLADFGSCLRLGEGGLVHSRVAVGTPDYISPEILRAMEDNQGTYGPECDWWSLGVCMYEMLFGETPFYAESLLETYGKIMNHKSSFDFPEDTAGVSEEAKDLIRHLVCSADVRLGQNGVEDFKVHPWFAGIDWDAIRDSEAPFIPQVSSPTDTSNFDVDELTFKNADSSAPPAANAVFSGLHLPFVGFTFTSHSQLSEGLGGADGPDTVDATVERDEARRLREEINKLRARNSEIELELKTVCLSMAACGDTGGTGASAGTNGEMSAVSCQIRDMERLIKNLSRDKDDLKIELQESQERLAQMTKEMKDQAAQLKTAMSEYNEVSDRLSDLRAQKQRLSRQVRDKEEEVESIMHKIDTLRQELRKADRLRREQETHVEEAQAEALKERRLRERSDEYVRHLETELEALRTGAGGGSNGTSSSGDLVVQLKAELQEQDKHWRELEAQWGSRTQLEISGLKHKLIEAQQGKELLEEEVHRLRRAAEESGNGLGAGGRSRIQALDEELSRARSENERLVALLQRGDQEMAVLREKHDLIANWETQITEIIQWVSDEKDAREYLQALATKMTQELDYLRGIPSSGGGALEQKNWRNRRSQKLDKMELLALQSSLQSEIQAKQAVAEELTQVRAEMVAQHKELERLRQELAEKDKALKDALSSPAATKELDEGDTLLDQFLKDTAGQREVGTPSPLVNTATTQGVTVGSSLSLAMGSRPSSRNLVISSPILQGAGTYSDALNKSLQHANSTTATTIPVTAAKLKAHQFLVRSFIAPLKCNQCTSLMLGLSRQGVVCEVCGFACHVSCQDRVPAQCPVPADQHRQGLLSIDPTKGVGTAYEGYVKVPKVGGVKKGWQRQFVAVCDFKLFLYDTQQLAGGPGSHGSLGHGASLAHIDKIQQACVSATQVLDMRDPDFMVSAVLESDVIHANRKDVPCIFRIATSMLDPPGLKSITLMMVDRESEKNKWVDALAELHRILKRNKLAHRRLVEPKQLLDSTLSIIKNCLSAVIISKERVLLGTEEGLFCVDLDNDEICKVGYNKKIEQLEYLPEEQLILCISGKQRNLRLIPVAALDLKHSVDWIKVADTKGCVTFCTTRLFHNHQSTHYFCVAVKKQVFIHQINRSKTRHGGRQIISLAAPVQCLDVIADRLCVGCHSIFYLYSLEALCEPVCLVQPDSNLSFVYHAPIDALMCIELPNYEYLLVFSQLGVFVNSKGKKSRERELMFASAPIYVSLRDEVLCVYAESHVDCFDVTSGEWLQTVNLRRTRPLNRQGTLCLSQIGDQPHVVYMHPWHLRDNLIMIADVLHGAASRCVEPAHAITKISIITEGKLARY